jgi:hypothetical protein
LLCDKAYRFRANIDRVIPEYLVLTLKTPTIMGKINDMKTAISDSGVNFTQKMDFLQLSLVFHLLMNKKKLFVL